MISRYDIMTDSITQVDSVDQQVYPDPLSIDYASFQYNEPPYIVDVDDRIQLYAYTVTNAFYKVAAYDDIIFSINNVPHRSLLMKTKVYDGWNPAVTYDLGDTIMYGSEIYSSLKGYNVNHVPGTSPYTAGWDVLVTYITGNVIYFEQNVYISLLNNNLGNTPNTSPTYWKLSNDSPLWWTTSESTAYYPTIKFPVAVDLNKFMVKV